MFCKECGAWLGEDEIQVCKECGAELSGDTDGKDDWLKAMVEETVRMGKDVALEVTKAARSDVEKGLTKKGKKMVDTTLKKVGLKQKTPVDVIREKVKKTMKKLKK